MLQLTPVQLADTNYAPAITGHAHAVPFGLSDSARISFDYV